MSESQMSDGQFTRIFFSMIIGGVILTLVLITLANLVGGGRNNVSEVQQKLRDEKIAQHVEPIGKMNVGEVATAAPASQPAAATGPVSGKASYESTCTACHAAGVAGAPKYGDSSAWKDRISQGKEVLYQHALTGFKGKAGFMPPRGGSSLSDAAVKAAVDYMLEAVK